jgi:hypothetical protein
LRDRADLYPEGMAKDVASTFRARVMNHIGGLVPHKKAEIDEHLDKVDNAFYDKAMVKHRKAMVKHRKRLREFKKAQKKAEQEYAQNYKSYSKLMKEYNAFPVGDEPEPPPSSADILASSGVTPPEDLASDASNLWESFGSRFASRSGSALKVAIRADFVPFSTYLNTTTMDQSRKAVYWGVEPNAVESYPEWSQPQSRDLTDQDFSRILASARDWLSSPVLSEDIDGIVRDTQLRAALDLSIQTNNYRNAIHPKVYNDLLARLAGKPADETLLTVTAGEPVSETVRSEMPKVEFENKTADRLLARLDRVASMIQDKHQSEKWDKSGMPFEAAKAIVNEIDRIADELELAAYGEESMVTRQAQVLQREPDEPYMDTFQNPQSPHQTEADEPYMQAFSSDDSSGVHHGKAENGRPLAP